MPRGSPSPDPGPAAAPGAPARQRLGRRYRFLLAAVVALGLLARGAAVARGHGSPDDPDNYLPLARALAAGEGFVFDGRPTAYRPPLYPLVLVPLVAAFPHHLGAGIAALHLVLGAATILATAAAARRWGMGDSRALVAALIVACDPVLVAQCRSVMTETLAAFLVALTLAVLARGDSAGAFLGGLGFGLASLCRPSLLPAAALTAASACVAPPGRLADRLRRALLVGAATALTLAPWAWRNARVLGEPVFTTTHGGYTLALANNPVYYAEVLHGPPGAVWSGENQARWIDAIHRGTTAMTEPEADRYFARQGLRMLRERPADFAAASLARLGRFWGLAPTGAVYPRRLRAATAAWTAPLWVALLLGLVRPRAWFWPRVAAPMTILGLCVVHLLFWTDLRMRAPLVPAIALIAAGVGGGAQDPFSRPENSSGVSPGR